MLKEAETLLHILEARESFLSSALTRDPDIMAVAIARAEKAGLNPAEIATARKTEHLMRITYNVEQALQKKDEQRLGILINQMREENIEDPILARAEQALQVVQKQLEAHKDLSQVMISGTMKELKTSIDKAKDLLPEEEIARARRVLRKDEAREGLVVAIQGEKRINIQNALDAVQEFDINMPEIEIAHKVIKKMDLSRDITLALDKCDPTTLLKIVDEAKAHGVDSAKIAKAEEMIAKA